MIEPDLPGSAQISQDLDRALALLQAGELVAFPTETVYGLGADASNPEAVAKIFAAKGRPADHPLIVHLPGAAALDRWARDIPEGAHKLAAAFWPGPLTLILKRQASVLDAVTGGQDSIGLRVPDHRLALALLRAFGADDDGGVAAPSANRYGRISPTCAADVRAELGERVAMILDGGRCAVGIESTIVDFTQGTPRILRPGAISRTALAEVLGEDVLDSVPDSPATADNADTDTDTDNTNHTGTPRVSGSLAAHYAPRTPLRLVPAENFIAALHAELQPGHIGRIGRVGVLARTTQQPEPLPEGTLWRSAPIDIGGYARGLYATLRRFDAEDCAVILVESPPTDETWRAVADRLQRAACGSGKKDAT